MDNIFVNIVIGLIVTVIGGILTVFIYDYYRSRISAKVIRDPQDADLEGFFDLHERLFPENERNASEDFMRWIAEQKDNVDNRLNRE